MDIAIQFEKINLGDDRYLFKPLNTIRGTYDKKDNCFVSESGVFCYPIDGNEPDGDNYFFAPTTIDELKEKYGDSSDYALLENYLSIAMDNCYIGSYDYNDEIIKVIQIPFDSIEDQLNAPIEKQEDSQEEHKVKFTIGAEDIKKIRDLKTLKEIRSHLDHMLNISKNFEKEQSSTPKLKLNKKGSDKFNLKKLRKIVSSSIIGEDTAVNDITRAIIVNYKSKNPRHKSHIMVAGPTGTGKTEIVNIISKYLDVPFFPADATAYTKEGYVGKSVYSMLLGLIEAADGDIEKAQNGILIIDEIDKKFIDDGKSDASGQAVLHSLLKIMDRGIVEVDVNNHESVNFDTSNLTVICMGAFTDLFEKKKKEANKTSIGFVKKESSNQEIVITKEDIREYGNASEFMGRIGITTYTNELSIDNSIKLLKKSIISPLIEEKEFFKDLGVKITFTSAYIKEIAHMNYGKNEGARGLRNLVRESLEYAYDEVLLNPKIKKLKITKETAQDHKKYYVS